jgi:hypothetical protein
MRCGAGLFAWREDLYPASWSLKPVLRLTEPLKGDVGLRLAKYDIVPGLVLTAQGSRTTARPGRRPAAVRTDGARHNEFGDPALEKLTPPGMPSRPTTSIPA